VSVVSAIVVFAVVSATLLTLPPETLSAGVLMPAGDAVQLRPSAYGYLATLNFSWGWGAILEGSWAATADTVVTVWPRLNCVYCPLIRSYGVIGTSGTFNYTFGGPGQQFPDMTIAFHSSLPDTVHALESIRVAYPPFTALLAAGTVLSGTGPRAFSFHVNSPGAYLVGAWTGVNTTLWSYAGTPPSDTNCGAWPADSPSYVYEDTINNYLTPGDYSIGVAMCSTRPWNVTVTATIGFFYP